jgi:AcrR family transcriptional regulator
MKDTRSRPDSASSAIERDGRERRGGDTRQALILAGIDLFGDYGVKGTTTRLLCTASGANIAAIHYHFGSKDGLYLAVATYIADRMDAHFAGAVNCDIAALLASPLNGPAAAKAFASIVDHMAKLMVESDEVRTWAQVIVREQSTPTKAFDILYKGRMEKLQSLLANLAAACTGLSPNSDEIKFRVHALIGQVLVFAISRESLRRALKVERLTSAHSVTIRRILMAHVEVCLGVPPLDSLSSAS